VEETTVHICKGRRPGCLGVPKPGLKRFFSKTLRDGRIGTTVKEVFTPIPITNMWVGPAYRSDKYDADLLLSDAEYELREEIAGMEKKIAFMEDRRFYGMAKQRKKELDKLKERLRSFRADSVIN
jgi:hypothetical protein